MAAVAATRLTSPCDGCDARCCRSYTVHVTGADAYRIASGLGLEMVRFLGYVAEVERSETGFLLEAGGPTFSIILETARTGEPRRPCLFFRVDPATGEGRCGIYPLRPDACRRFPAYRRDDGGIAAREEVVCPDGAWVGHPMDRLSWRVALAREERERELYAVVVAEWNARVEAERGRPARTVERYLDHLSDAYGWITRMRHALPPRESAGPGLLVRVGEALREFPGR
ncbi:MAG TPA: YkgJ family cysteine cluster protein [Anaeromyxobacter sp.]